MHPEHTPSGPRWVVFLLMLFGTSCTTTGPIAPKYLDPSFVPATVDEIVLVSFVDIRHDKSLPFDLKDFMESTLRMGAVRRNLEEKGYTMSLADDFGQVHTITENEISVADASWVKSLGPQNAKWVLLVGLKDLSVHLTFGKRATAQCLGVLYDKTPGKAVWSHEAFQEARAGGLGGMLATDQWMGKDALLMCTVHGLFPQLPPKK
jgi:hypothetical protein